MKKSGIIIVALITATVIVGEITTANGQKEMVLDSFSKDREINSIGGQTGCWQQYGEEGTDWIRSEKIEYKRNSEKTDVLKLSYSVSDETINGYFSRLNGLDVRGYENLEFYIKGGETYPSRIKIDLKNMDGDFAGYYIVDINTDWRKISIPINELRGMDDFSSIDEFLITLEGRFLGSEKGTFYLDELKLTGSREEYDRASKIAEKELEKIQEDINKIVELEDDKLLDLISRTVFDYFWNETGEKTGFVRDRTRQETPSSIAATGFGLSAICIGVERGWVEEARAKQRVRKVLRNMKERADGHKGYFYHFINMNTGEREWESELSSIDTALFLGGVITAWEYFDDPEISEIARDLYESVEWPFMMDEDTKTLYMGWDPEGGFEDYIRWDKYSEQMMMYILGLGSPAHPLPEDSWHAVERPVKTYDDYTYIYCKGESLFVYLFSHAFVDFRNKHDDYADYWKNNKNAIKAHIAFCRNNPTGLKTLEEGFWGISAGDGPDGYRNHGATVFTTDGTITPYAVVGSYPFVPDDSIKTIRKMLSEYGGDLWCEEYGFVSAFNLDRNWFSTEHIGIDLGITLLMLENYRSNFVWDYFMQNEYVSRGMERAGFQEGTKELEYDPSDIEEVLYEMPVYNARNIEDFDKLTEEDYIRMDPDMAEFVEAEGRIDLEAGFALGWNEEYLFLRAKVDNENVIAEREQEFLYQNDCIELFISPDMVLEWGSSEHFQIGISPTGPDGEPLTYAFFQNENPGENVKVSCEKTNTGYEINAAVKWDYLGIEPEIGKTVGLSVAVHDVNTPHRDGAGGTKLNWAFEETPNGIMLGEFNLVE